MDDLLSGAGREAYSAKDIEVLEGLEPVRRRPGMYVGGTDEAALHHLATELLDNAMDEAVAGHATTIEMTLEADGFLRVADNGRGIPVDPHPKFPKQSALEVILTTLHSGGKFGGDAYNTSGGLHGVGSSVVNALSETLEVEVARNRTLWKQRYAKGKPVTKLINAGAAPNRRGTTIRFRADPEIFGAARFDPRRLYRLCRSKAYLFRGVTIRWGCEAPVPDDVPARAVLHFPGGLADSLREDLGDAPRVVEPFWEAVTEFGAGADGKPAGRAEWVVAWARDEDDAKVASYCNTIATPQGGTHETGFRAAALRAFRAWGEQRGEKRAALVTGEDVAGAMAAKLSVFVRNPQFQGQTKERLSSPEAGRLVETAARADLDHWLAASPATADILLGFAIERAEERIRRREGKTAARKSLTRKLRLPGKLVDCTSERRDATEIFLVEGDSAGGSAKQARDRETQAVLPLRGKILNVASASAEKLATNAELRDLVEALGCGSGKRFDADALRYGRVVIMTDADVDGAHIASLLITFFQRELPGLVAAGRLHLARPPLFRLTQGARSVYAMDDAERDRMIAEFKPGAKVEISRFKGLGEMPSAVLRDTTMHPAKRVLLKVTADDDSTRLIERLMGRNPEHRLSFIQERARTVEEVDV